jgi:UDP-N-acetylmuramate dehydrogenase
VALSPAGPTNLSVTHNAAIDNSFGVAARANRTVTLQSDQQLDELRHLLLDNKYLILGGASNVLISRDYDGTVVRNQIKGMSIKRLGGSIVKVRCGAGENWAAFVDAMVAHGFFGLENLSLIPGSVGASPIQNIGAYGVEMHKCFSELSAFNLTTGKTQQFTKTDCAFGYRDSVFKQASMRDWIITEVCFVLNEAAPLELGYGDLKTEAQALAAAKGLTKPSAVEVAQAVKSIRTRKLPDPSALGNAGSFFKNPAVQHNRVAELQARYPSLPTYPIANDANHVKLSAGWLIDQAGWKGYRRGDAGVHKDHALVLVNYGAASGMDIWQLALDIQTSVLAKFGIAIEPEPILI